MADNRLPGWFKSKPADDGDDRAKLNDQLAAAAAVTIAEKTQGCALHIRLAAMKYLEALREMGAASVRFEELQSFGLDVGSCPFGPVEGLATTYREFAISLVRGGVISAEDPLVADIDLDDPPADPVNAG
ncbi:MAG: hypothetical protein U0804_17115 [Gemmataceae bacterium]